MYVMYIVYWSIYREGGLIKQVCTTFFIKHVDGLYVSKSKYHHSHTNTCT